MVCMVCNCRSFKWNPASTSSVSQWRQRGEHKESLMLFEVRLRQVRFSTLWCRLVRRSHDPGSQSRPNPPSGSRLPAAARTTDDAVGDGLVQGRPNASASRVSARGPTNGRSRYPRTQVSPSQKIPEPPCPRHGGEASEMKEPSST